MNNTQMTDEERGLFSFLHGITGMLVAVVLLLSILGVLTFFSIDVQQREAKNFYTINKDINGLTSGSVFSSMKQNTSEEQQKNYIKIDNKK